MIVVCIGCWAHAQQPKFVMNGRAQGTTYSIQYFHPTEVVVQTAIDSALEVIDLSMSTYKQNSKITLFNSPETQSIAMDGHMQNVVRKAFAVHKKSKGLFDVTVKPLVDLWGFGPEQIKVFPQQVAIDSALQNVGMDKLRILGKKLVKKRHAISIDLNGIAQGYTVDVLSDLLEQHGIENYLVELGGEIRAKGSKDDGQPFQIGIERPDDAQASFVLRLKDNAVTTSGNYRKTYTMDGKKIHHHIDPKTGYPVQNNIASVTVIAKTAMDADAYDNVFMAMSVADGLKLANALKDTEIYVIYQEGEAFKEAFSKGFYNYVKN